jgi:ubiquinone/menaquinone biosynthesis C-methylase UbiE
MALVSNSEKIRSQYNRVAPVFSVGSTLTFPHRDYVNREIVQPRLQLDRGQTVLDLCCGAGLNFPYIEEFIGPTGRLIGLDFSDRLVERARALAASSGWANVAVIEGDALELPDLVKEPVDAVICSLAMCLIPDKPALLRAIRSVLRPNGRLAVFELRPFSGFARIFNPLLLLMLAPIPVNIKAVFREAPLIKDLLDREFHQCVHAEFCAGSIYLGIARNEQM